MTKPVVLHYVGYKRDGGGILTVVRNLAATGRFECVLGVSPGFVAQNPESPVVQTFPVIEAERIGPAELWRARRIARAVQTWLAEDQGRVFHGHSRAGLLVALWLARWSEQRVVASVHCYGRQRWFYRWAARRLRDRLFWLTPTMRNYYGVHGSDWDQCIPGGVLPTNLTDRRREAGLLRVGGIGTLVSWKRWDLVLSALANLHEEVRRKIRFEHIGGTLDTAQSVAYAEALRAETKAWGLEQLVYWRGPEPSSGPLLASIDVLVVSSINEPLSMAMVEALAAGVPVLAADSGGPLDVIRPGKNGLLFRSGDAASLAAALEGLATGRLVAKLPPEEIQRTAIYADDVARRWESIYSRLTSGHRD